jgi:sporulation protein YlmC with PRC-barrel domain
MTNRHIPFHLPTAWGLGLLLALAPTSFPQEAPDILPGPPPPIPHYRSGSNEFGLPAEQGPQHGSFQHPPSPRQLERQVAELSANDTPEATTHSANALFDHIVTTRAGENLGPIEDLIIDTRSGRIEFVAVGPGEPLRIIPPEALRPRPDQGLMQVRITEDQWRRAPSLRREQLHLMADDQAQAVRDVYGFYGVDYNGPERIDGPQPSFGSPAQRSQQRPIPQTRLPGDPPGPQVTPPIIPPDHTEVHPEMRREREVRPPVGPEDETVDPTAPEWRGRPFEEETAPTIDRPRARGPRGVPHRTRPMPPAEFGARTDRPDAEWATVALPTAESLRWISDLMEQEVFDLNQESLGIVSDFRISNQVGRVSHAIVWNETERQQYALPLTAIQIEPQDRLTALPSIEELQRAPRYDERQARRRPQQVFRYDPPAEPEFGAPGRRQPETPPN